MSAYREMKTVMRDRDCLVKSLKKRFPKALVEVHESPVALYGYRGDAREDKANVVIRRKYVGIDSNDIGFARQNDGSFNAVISEFDTATHSQAWLDRLMETYQEEKSMQEMTSHDCSLEERRVLPDGSIQLTFTVG